MGTAARPVQAATTAIRSRLWWAAIGGVSWFAITAAAELLAGGASVDGSLFVAAIAVTCLAGALFGRSLGDDVALALGSVAGLVLSSLLVATEPGAPPIEDVLSVASYLGIAVVVLTPLFRRLVDWLRTV